ncbi:GntR family transcriptional regulator [Sciscionella marina]|uniref:GntR family transcriptional regulator n=1 Tax=Sciscionella marina TaxID=508770 RepID=UPI000370EDDF|nr:GntR family transcriptional regulator [Sciscionella marina]
MTGYEAGLTPAQARSRLVRVKTSDAVADNVLDLLFAGELRPGDRIDIDGLAEMLGVSRAPVREALVMLERDGLVEIRYHRGAFVADLDAAAVRESFELYGLLTALSSRRVAERRDPAVLEALDTAIAEIEEADSVDEFEIKAREYRRIVNRAFAGSRLRAVLRTFSGLVPAASRLTMPRSIDRERDLLRAEHAAIGRGDPDAATEAVVEHIWMLGELAVQTLREREVIGEEEDEDADRRDHAEIARTLDVLESKRRARKGAAK